MSIFSFLVEFRFLFFTFHFFENDFPLCFYIAKKKKKKKKVLFTDTPTIVRRASVNS